MRFRRLLPCFGLLLLLAAPAGAQISSQGRRCIEAINAGARAMARAEQKAIRRCAKNLARGSLAGQSVAQCAASLVQSQATRALAKVTGSCGGVPPSFGPPSISAQASLAQQSALDLDADVLGAPLDNTLLATTPERICQDAILGVLQKCADARLHEFGKCKHAGLARGIITDAVSLQDQCLGTGSDQPDPKGVIGRFCITKPPLAILSRCTGVDLDQTFPGCGAGGEAGLSHCIDIHARCRTCALLNAVDGLARDCDAIDDGNDANESCPEPTVCGDGVIDGTETCDDFNAAAGDGCSASCQIEAGWTCAGQPSLCGEICGDGLRVGDEGCDDGDTSPGDGCNVACQVETGYHCTGSPSSCAPTCGDGLIIGGEACDDGDATSGDGCSATCQIEPGFVCTGQPSTCTRFTVVITAPVHGVFTQASSATVTGFITQLAPAAAALTVNGAAVPIAPNRSFTTSVPLDAAAIFNPIRAVVTDLSNGATASARVVAIRGASVADGALSPHSLALRLGDSGLDDVEPLVAALAGSGLNLAQLVPVGTVLINDQCFVDTPFGCAGSATVKIKEPAPSFQSFGLDVDSMTNFVAGDITVNGIRVDVRLDGSGVVPDCDATITADAAFFNGDYSLEPATGDPSHIDVNQIGPEDVSFTGFHVSYGGLCDAPVIGDIIQALLPDIKQLTIDAIADFLDDPDGDGPADSPPAAAIQSALAGVSLAEPLTSGLGVVVHAPFFQVAEDTNGITFGADSSFQMSLGSGTGQCTPPPFTANLTASLATNPAFPVYGTTTAVAHLPYDVAVGLSTDALNQILKSQIECGLLNTTLTTLDLNGPVPITAGLLSLLLPEFSVYPPQTPFRLGILPTLAPIVTANPGPGGELAELRVSHVLLTVTRNDGSEEVPLIAAFDAELGLNLTFGPEGLSVVLTPPQPGDLHVAILTNLLGLDETALAGTVGSLVTALLPDLGSSLGSIPLPSFFGLDLSGVEVSRTGGFFSVFANLTPTP